MKNRIILLSLLMAAGCCFAQEDSLYMVQQQRIASLEQEVKNLKRDVAYLTGQANTLHSQMNNLTSDVDRKIEGQQSSIEGISKDVAANAENLWTTTGWSVPGVEPKS